MKKSIKFVSFCFILSCFIFEVGVRGKGDDYEKTCVIFMVVTDGVRGS